VSLSYFCPRLFAVTQFSGASLGVTATSSRLNFGFLARYDPALLTVAVRAEQYFSADPVTCLMKLRQFGELVAQQVAAHGRLCSRSTASATMRRKFCHLCRAEEMTLEVIGRLLDRHHTTVMDPPRETADRTEAGAVAGSCADCAEAVRGGTRRIRTLTGLLDIDMVEYPTRLRQGAGGAPG
jgi:hypothetical protein